MGALWNEIKNWRRSEHWNARKFFQALVLDLLFTLLDTGTDFDFARGVPDECPKEGNQQRIETNHCPHFVSKGVKFFTYTFIALPGIMLSFSALHSLLRDLWNQSCGARRFSKDGCAPFLMLLPSSYKCLSVQDLSLCQGFGRKSREKWDKNPTQPAQASSRDMKPR